MENQLPDHYAFSLGGLHYPMVRVRPGTFIMGSEGRGNEKPEHLVCLTRDYYIGVYPVTQAVWKAVMRGHNPSRFQGDERPVEMVSWRDIVEGGQDEKVPEAFLARLNKRCPAPESALAHFRFCLPTEAEWEYAAKGGHHTALSDAEIKNPPRADERYLQYAGSNKSKEVGWFDLNSHDESKAVGLKHPNELGLYDMSGNVEEWCADWLDRVYYKRSAGQGIVENPTGPENGSNRVLRGGSWGSDPDSFRSSSRSPWFPSIRRNFMGFRLVLAL